MKNLLILLLLLLIRQASNAQNLELQTFGDAKYHPVIFLHGGPGYNSVIFEQTTAEELSRNGFFVISYDRRGEGRNEDLEANFTFEQTFRDLNGIYSDFNLEKATLVGHSFGGIVAAFYAEEFPEKIESIVLASVPISMQNTFRTIIESSKKIYQDKEDKVNLSYIAQLEQMDTLAYGYAAYSFMHAMSNGFYSPSQPNSRAKELYQKMKSDSLVLKYASKNSYLAPMKFWENEAYTSIDLKENLKILNQEGIEMHGIYGKDDGLYSEEQVNTMRKILGDDKVKYLDNCSHSVFVDRQQEFIDVLIGLKK